MKGHSKTELWLLGQSFSVNMDLKKTMLCHGQLRATAATVGHRMWKRIAY